MKVRIYRSKEGITVEYPIGDFENVMRRAGDTEKSV